MYNLLFEHVGHLLFVLYAISTSIRALHFTLFFFFHHNRPYYFPLLTILHLLKKKKPSFSSPEINPIQPSNLNTVLKRFQF